MDKFVYYFLLCVVIILIVLVFLCFIRALRGPSVADRVVSVNMIGTLVIMIIAVLTVLMKEAWLADIAAIYAMISFLAVVVLTKIYLGVYRQKQAGKEQAGKEQDKK